MKKRYSVCREYLVPVYQYIEVEAENTEEACAKACDDIAYPWDRDTVDYESAGPTYIAAIAEVPDDMDDPNPYDLPNEPIPPTYTGKFIMKGHIE